MSKLSPAMQAMYDRAKRETITYFRDMGSFYAAHARWSTGNDTVNINTLDALLQRKLLRVVHNDHLTTIYAAKETD